MILKDKLETIKALSKVLNEDEDLQKNKKVVSDSSCVLLVIANKKENEQILGQFGDSFKGETKTPNLKYDSRSNFCIEYFQQILNVIKATGETKLTLKVGTDYPLTVETENFTFILAPRVEN